MKLVREARLGESSSVLLMTWLSPSQEAPQMWLLLLHSIVMSKQVVAAHGLLQETKARQSFSQANIQEWRGGVVFFTAHGI